MGCGTSKEEAIAVVNDAIDAVQNGALNHHQNNSTSTVNNKDHSNDPVEAEKPPPSESPPEEDTPASTDTNPESSSSPDQNPSDSDNGNDTSAVPEANETTETNAPEGESEAASEQTNKNTEKAVKEEADGEEKAGLNQEDNEEVAEATESVEASEISTAEIENDNANEKNGTEGTPEKNASAPQSDISGECNDGDVHISTPSPILSQSSICGTRGNSVEEIDPEEDEGTVLDGNCNENDPTMARMDSAERLIPADEGLEEAIENDFSEEGEKLKRSESRSSETSVNSTNSSPKTVRSRSGSPNGGNENEEEDDDSGVVCEKKENEIENEDVEEEGATGSSASSDCIEDEEDVGKDDVVPKEALMIVAGSPTIMERRKGLFG